MNSGGYGWVKLVGYYLELRVYHLPVFMFALGDKCSLRKQIIVLLRHPAPVWHIHHSLRYKALFLINPYKFKILISFHTRGTRYTKYRIYVSPPYYLPGICLVKY